uniref:Ion transport domain-containing protein n=1 Tax=Pinguiococcus pyrenoidosus TaxID=172671 RepID=A0A7R9UG60_9STRA|mmetsp:Transcript_9191/g.34566  ORF Transcript_9191/g.34566 Transcript_9191/m.34566 type:complete len:929 (+) Transcript_9191:268-3054(+)
MASLQQNQNQGDFALELRSWAQKGRPDKIRALFQRHPSSSDMPTGDSLGHTALVYAASTGDEALVHELLKHSGTTTASDADAASGVEPVHVAAYFGHAAVIRLLHENCGASVLDAKTGSGHQALHFAAYFGHVEAMAELLDLGADIEAESSAGARPVYLAVLAGREDAVALLLERGAYYKALLTPAPDAPTIEGELLSFLHSDAGDADPLAACPLLKEEMKIVEGAVDMADFGGAARGQDAAADEGDAGWYYFTDPEETSPGGYVRIGSLLAGQRGRDKRGEIGPGSQPKEGAVRDFRLDRIRAALKVHDLKQTSRFYELRARRYLDGDSTRRTKNQDLVEQQVYLLSKYLELSPRQVEEVAGLTLIRDTVDRIISCHRAFAMVVLDGAFLVLLVTLYLIGAWTFQQSEPLESHDVAILIALIVCTFYLLVREGRQIWVLSKREELKYYFANMNNYFDLFSVLSGLVLTIATLAGPAVRTSATFRITAATFCIPLWGKVLNFLKAMGKDFATFVMAQGQIMKDLVSFMAVLVISLVGFTSIMYILMRPRLDDAFGDDENQQPFNTVLETLLTSYRIFLGDFDRDWIDAPDDPASRVIACGVFVLFLMIMNVLLLNVLIAVVSNSYETALNRSRGPYYRARLELAAELQYLLDIRLEKRAPRGFRQSLTYWFIEAVMYKTRIYKWYGRPREIFDGPVSTLEGFFGVDPDAASSGTAVPNDQQSRGLAGLSKEKAAAAPEELKAGSSREGRTAEAAMEGSRLSASRPAGYGAVVGASDIYRGEAESIFDRCSRSFIAFELSYVLVSLLVVVAAVIWLPLGCFLLLVDLLTFALENENDDDDDDEDQDDEDDDEEDLAEDVESRVRRLLKQEMSRLAMALTEAKLATIKAEWKQELLADMKSGVEDDPHAEEVKSTGSEGGGGRLWNVALE